MWSRIATAAVIAALAAPAWRDALAQEGEGIQAMPFPPTRRVAHQANPAAGWKVQLALNRSDGVYRIGERLEATVTSERDGYLYVLNLYGCDAQGKHAETVLLFPNEFQHENRVAAGQPVHIPAADAAYDLQASPPPGVERIKVFVSRQPNEQYEKLRPGQGEGFAAIGDRPFVVTEGPQSWAEACADVRIVSGEAERHASASQLGEVQP